MSTSQDAGPSPAWVPASAGTPPRPSAQRVLPAQRPSGGPLGDRRGLTAAGATVLVLLLGGAGVAVDLATGHGLRAVFAVLFVAACGLAALQVHREDLVASILLPPLAYAVLTILADLVQRPTGSLGTGLKDQVVDMATSMVIGAPVLMVATGLAVVVALTRGRLARSRRPRR